MWTKKLKNRKSNTIVPWELWQGFIIFRKVHIFKCCFLWRTKFCEQNYWVFWEFFSCVSLIPSLECFNSCVFTVTLRVIIFYTRMLQKPWVCQVVPISQLRFCLSMFAITNNLPKSNFWNSFQVACVIVPSLECFNFCVFKVTYFWGDYFYSKNAT